MRLKALINLSAELANNSDFAYGGVKESITRELIAEVQRTICKERRWSWLLKTTTFETVAGQEEYLLPRDLREIYTIIEGSTPNKLTYIGQDDFDILRPLTTERGIPTHYRLFGRRNDVYNTGVVSVGVGSNILYGEEVDWTVKNNIYPHQKVTIDNTKEVYTIASVTPATAKHWTVYNIIDNDHLWGDIIYGNGKYVAVSTYTDVNPNQRVITSPDGINWTFRDTPNMECTGIAYGNNQFVVVSRFSEPGKRVMTSPDGLVWTSQDTPIDSWWFAVAYGNERFVAVARDGMPEWRAMVSFNNGTIWKMALSLPEGMWRDIAYGNGLFIAVADGGPSQIMTSPDGFVWTNRPAPNDNYWSSIAYGNGMFVAIAIGWNLPENRSKRVMTSPDGINWTAHSIPSEISECSLDGITYGSGLFVITGSRAILGNFALTSYDGTNWTIHYLPNGDWDILTYGRNKFVMIGDRNNKSIVSEIVNPITLHEKVVTVANNSTYSIKIDNEVIRFYPIPDSKITMTLKYFQNVLDLRDDEDESIIPDDTVLAYGTAMIIKAKNEEDPTWLSNMYDKILKDMRKIDDEKFDHMDQFSPPVRQFQNQWNPFVI